MSQCASGSLSYACGSSLIHSTNFDLRSVWMMNYKLLSLAGHPCGYVKVEAGSVYLGTYKALKVTELADVT